MKTKTILVDLILPLALTLTLCYSFYTFMEDAYVERKVDRDTLKQEIKDEKDRQIAQQRLRFEVIVKDTFYYENEEK